MIQLQNVSKQYRMTATNTVQALDDISLTIGTGEVLACIGSSGSGKSSLLNILGGLDRKYTGQVYVDDKDIKIYNPNYYRRRKVGTIFQQFHLLAPLTVKENVILPIRFGHQYSAKEAKNRAKYLLDRVGLTERMGHKPAQLSGGQMQRVAIARALMAQPEIILADEPTGNLDSKTGQDIMHLLEQINQEEQVTVILVTHDQEVAQTIPRKIYLKDGKIEHYD